MSRRKKGPTPRRTPDDPDAPIDDTAVWVTSECSPDGVYFPAVVYKDHVIALDRDTAIAYGLAVLAVVEDAVHDAAVANLLVSLDLPIEVVALAVRDIRADRPAVDQSACSPLRFDAIVSGSTGLPFVHVYLGDEAIAQWLPKDAVGHAAHVMGAPFCADHDEALRRVLVGVVGTPDDTARAVVGGLGEHRRDQHDGAPA